MVVLGRPQVVILSRYARTLKDEEITTLKEQRQHHIIELSKSDVYNSLATTKREYKVIK